MYQCVMMAAISLAFAIVRVPRDAPQPSEEVLRRAVDADRERLGLPAGDGTMELMVAGPYAVIVDGAELDEYAVWDR